jgi:hypothetical protein
VPTHCVITGKVRNLSREYANVSAGVNKNLILLIFLVFSARFELSDRRPAAAVCYRCDQLEISNVSSLPRSMIRAQSWPAAQDSSLETPQAQHHLDDDAAGAPTHWRKDDVLSRVGSGLPCQCVITKFVKNS